MRRVAVHIRTQNPKMNEQRSLYDVVTSQLVIDEARMGDADAASRRLKMLDGIPVLPVNLDANMVADEIVGRAMMPWPQRRMGRQPGGQQHRASRAPGHCW